MAIQRLRLRWGGGRLSGCAPRGARCSTRTGRRPRHLIASCIFGGMARIHLPLTLLRGAATLRLQRLQVFFASSLHGEEAGSDARFDALHHLLEHPEPFTLVLALGITLPVSTQTDTVAQGIHGL